MTSNAHPKPARRHVLGLLGASLLALAQAAHGQSIVFDPHLDLPPSAASPEWTGVADPASQFDLQRARQGGLTAAGIALFVPQGDRSPAALAEAKWSLTAHYRALRSLTDGKAGAELALAPDDVRRIVQAGKFAVVETLLNAWPLGDDLDEIDRWYGRGVRFFGFVHAGNNQFADSSRPALARGDKADENGGLSPLGRDAVTRLNDLGAVIDVSQLSDRAFDQVLALSRAPVIASHSGLRGRVDVPRNLTDAQLDALKAKGGVIGIVAFSAYTHIDSAATQAAIAALKQEFGLPATGAGTLPSDRQADYARRLAAIRAAEPKASLSEFVDAIDLAVKRIGVDHVAIASDFNHGGGVTGWSNVGETANVTAELRRRGYSQGDIDKLWGSNLLRVWQAAIDARNPGYVVAR